MICALAWMWRRTSIEFVGFPSLVASQNHNHVNCEFYIKCKMNMRWLFWTEKENVHTHTPRSSCQLAMLCHNQNNTIFSVLRKCSHTWNQYESVYTPVIEPMSVHFFFHSAFLCSLKILSFRSQTFKMINSTMIGSILLPSNWTRLSINQTCNPKPIECKLNTSATSTRDNWRQSLKYEASCVHVFTLHAAHHD